MQSGAKVDIASVPAERRGFTEELRALGEAVPHKTLFAGLLLAWVALFHFYGNPTLGYVNTRSLFGWLENSYSRSSDDNFGAFVPVAVIGLLWWKREELAAVTKRIWWPPLILFLLGTLLHIAGYTVQQTRLSVAGFFFGVYALVGLLWGWKMMCATFFPFFLFVFSMPLTSELEGKTLSLRILAAQLAVWTSHLIGIDDLVRQGTRLVHEKRNFFYDVEAACSGMRSLTVMLAMGCVFGFVFFRENWKRALMIFSAIPIAVASNLLRLISVVVGGTYKYDELKAAHQPQFIASQAAQKFGMMVHDHAVLKYIPYVLGFTVMMLLAHWMEKERHTKKAERPGTP